MADSNSDIDSDSNTKANFEISNSFFLMILFAVIISWILVQLWTRAIETFFYNYAGMSENSSWHTFLVAAFFTIIFITFVACSGETADTIKANLAGITLTSPSIIKSIVEPSNLIPY